MSGQLDLLPRFGVEVKPEPGRREPRFWVRRLVMWKKPGTLLREIVLRPGLNIIWSPDPADQGMTPESESVLGHGSGKTLFCRLLRYVLGEDSFSPDDQRFRIGLAFPEGMVGAEVMIDGTQWAVLRPIGSHRLHYAVPDAGLEQVLAADYAATGIEPFLKAVESQILSADVVALIPVEHPLQAWQVALAWLSRDQECRFDKVLDWRSSDSDSGSPARGLSTTKLLDALRALIGAIVPEEYKLRAEIGALESSQKETEQEAVRHASDADRVRARLISELGLNPNELLPGRLAVEPLRQAAKAKLARLATVSPDVDVSDLDALRSQADEAREQAECLKRTLAEVEARIPEIEGLMRRIRGERPGISAEIDQHETPLCPVCDVPISRALAEGCKLSHKLPDLDAAKKRLEQNNQELGVEDARLKANQAQKVQITLELNPAQSRAESLRLQVREIERSRDARSDAWGKTKQLITDAGSLEEYLLAQEKKHASAEVLVGEIEKKRALTTAFRDAQADVFSRLSRSFDAIIREMVGPNAGGKVTLDGNGLKLSVELGGERSTAAIDSLKVIAFDLAVMCMSIEGGVRLPAFLIHDSPREADLGLSVYHRLFHLVRNLEQGEGQPLFQYIVTTTTRPPDDLSDMPWLRGKLGGAPTEARLLGRDL
ncbi:MAG: hypothetical protein ACYCUY_02415 [Acidithiobacillus sp.]